MDPAQSTSAAQQGRRNLLFLTAASFLRGAHNSIYMAIWQPFALSLGASMPVVGILNSIGGINGVVTALAQSVGGLFADRLGHKLFLIIAGLATLVCFIFLALADLGPFMSLLWLGVIFYGISQLSRPTLYTLTADSVDPAQYGRVFSLVTLSMMLPGVFAPILGGWVVERFGYTEVFVCMLFLETLGLFLIGRYIRDIHQPSGAPIQFRDAIRAMLHTIIPPKGLVAFFCVVAGDAFAWGMGWGILYGMLRESFDFTVKQIGILSSVMFFTWAVTQIPIGRYIDRRGTKKMMIFSEAIGIPLMLVWMTQTRFEFFVAGQVLFGFTAATWVPTTNTYLAHQVREEERAEVFGRLNAFRGLIGCPAPFIGGWLYEWGGIRVPVIANLIGIFIVIAILVFFVHEPEKGKIQD